MGDNKHHMVDGRLASNLEAYFGEQYHCHTVILYGSYATGDETPESDIDVVAFTDEVLVSHDNKMLEGKPLDAWFYPTSAMANTADFLRIKDGEALIDQRGLGRGLLAAVQERFAAGPERVDREELIFLCDWLLKMVKRSLKGDAEGNYRYHWLLTDSLEIYGKASNQWYMGPKQTLKWLERHDKAAYDLFCNALRRDAADSDIYRLIKHVRGAAGLQTSFGA
ncbi:nucleotidyltransferase domain-containing protein [Paenibacillus tarimensis]|uniref:nucleotidyltransferase domain-containing protein n=1 Tax=Paenibacillus tarimensis TaxID=416012 RepID=UPI001F482578|nr:nucleotidyltransferase domain-containing protein [Paenibacillus tarimensis]MCF2946076.1 nucleotidyltransferase domain-containing protein [Paenibacillus tarimensis]